MTDTGVAFDGMDFVPNSPMPDLEGPRSQNSEYIADHGVV